MYQTAAPVTTQRPLQRAGARCPQCGTPVSGIAATEPGRHEFVDCGHRASSRTLGTLSSP